MKRFYAAIILLAAVALGGLFNLYMISDTVDSLNSTLSQAQELSQKNLSAAIALTEQAQQKYQRREPYLSAVVSEKLLDAIRLGFARTQASISLRDRTEFTLELSALRQAIDDLLRSEAIGLKNLF